MRRAQIYVQLLFLLDASCAALFAAGDDVVERHAAGAKEGFGDSTTYPNSSCTAQQGDTLAQLAQSCCNTSDLAAVAAASTIRDVDKIYPGDQICCPSGAIMVETHTAERDGEAYSTLASGSPQPHLPADAGSSCSSVQKVLDAHNAERRKWGAGPLGWSSSLAQRAQRAVNTCRFQHTGSGENLYLNSVPATSCEAAVPAWNDEQRFWYQPGNPDFSLCTGHWTQVVWKSTKEVGCARKYCPNLHGTFVACEYSPSGNFLGEFASQVGKGGGPHCPRASEIQLVSA